MERDPYQWGLDRCPLSRGEVKKPYQGGRRGLIMDGDGGTYIIRGGSKGTLSDGNEGNLSGENERKAP